MSITPDGFYDAALQPRDASTSRDEDFRTLLERVREGSEEAAWDLIELYGPHILRAVRRKLNARMRPMYDSTDFVQAVWASFFTSRTQVIQFNKPEELIGFLVTVAHNKVIDEVRRRIISRKYGIVHEQPLHDSTVPGQQAAIGPHPTPSQVAVARERWQQMLASQPAKHREVLNLRYQGETYEDIAEKVGMHERTVRRIVEEALGGA